ncbi:MAG: ABC transporter ATP-binding protein [Coriobacteriia bacterium]|nr:ABC transporter ATP-binding protein [Coriobacteriia bacterium]
MLLEVEDLRVQFPVKGGIVTAVEDVSFAVDSGETLAIVGESGSGKSVTALAIMGLLPETGGITQGRITLGGRVLHDAADKGFELKDKDYCKLRGNDMAMIFQEPMTSLNPVYRVGFQIAEAIRAHRKVSKREALSQAVSLLQRVGIPSPQERARDYPHQMSGGMRQRVMIAMALALNPKLLIADEPTTALDVTIQAQILDLINRLREEAQMAVVLVTHDLGVVSEVADQVVVMYCGQVVETACTRDILDHPLHPYTLGLLKSVPRLDDDSNQRLYMIRGSVPNPLHMPPGCHFSDRCDQCLAVCRQEMPALVAGGQDRMVRCHLFDQNAKEKA